MHFVEKVQCAVKAARACTQVLVRAKPLKPATKPLRATQAASEAACPQRESTSSAPPRSAQSTPADHAAFCAAGLAPTKKTRRSPQRRLVRDPSLLGTSSLVHRFPSALRAAASQVHQVWASRPFQATQRSATQRSATQRNSAHVYLSWISPALQRRRCVLAVGEELNSLALASSSLLVPKLPRRRGRPQSQ